MSDKKLKYELSHEAVDFLLQCLNRVQVVGVQTAESLLAVRNILQNPSNMEDLEKDQLEMLKQKFEKKEKK